VGKHDAAPTYGWVFTSQFHRIMSKIFLIILVLLAITIWTIFQRLEADCTDTVEQHRTIGKFDINFDVQRTCEAED
jgi:hypothetical protein